MCGAMKDIAHHTEKRPYVSQNKVTYAVVQSCGLPLGNVVFACGNVKHNTAWMLNEFG